MPMDRPVGRHRFFTAPAVVAGLGILLQATGCAAPPPAPLPPTLATVELSASRDANATASGQGAPVVVRVYQLASAAAFEKAEFFRLLNSDAATLGPDMIKKEEFLLAPGAKRTTTLTLPDSVKAIGLFGAFREFQGVTWRATVSPPPNKTTPVAVTVNASGLTATLPSPPRTP